MFERYRDAPADFFGSDSWNLTTASPWTGLDCLELVAPIQVLCYPTWESAILVRTGSKRSNNVEYFTSPLGAALKDRADFRRFIEELGLPLGTARVLKGLNRDVASALSPEKKQQAFEQLLEIGVDNVVCEGASRWLPAWPNNPVVDHLFFIANGKISYFPNLDLRVRLSRNGKPPTVHAVSKVLNDSKRPRFTAPLLLAEKSRREEANQKTVAELLARS